jgi:rare lipoprotein A
LSKNADIIDMKKIYLILVISAFIPLQLQAQSTMGTDVFRQEGIASWYGKEFEGRPTASGEIFDASQLTAAHPSLPFGTLVVVTNQHNNKKVTVRINDRGPFVAARVIDVSRAAAEQLDMIVTGTAPVFVESVERIVATSPGANQSQAVTPVNSVNSNSNNVNTVNINPVNDITTVVISQPPVTVQIPDRITLTPAIIITPDKSYRLQVGSYRIARNAVETFDKLKSSGLDPAYERFTNGENVEYFRVVLAGINGSDVLFTADKIRNAGFNEALIKEEN